MSGSKPETIAESELYRTDPTKVVIALRALPTDDLESVIARGDAIKELTVSGSPTLEEAVTNPKETSIGTFLYVMDNKTRLAKEVKSK